MKGTGSRLDRGVDDCASGSSEFGRVGSRLKPELLQRVGGRDNHLYRLLLQILGAGVVINSIKREIVLQLEVAIGAEATFGGIRNFAARVLKNPWFQKGQLIVISSIQRQVIDLFIRNDDAYVGGLRLQLNGGCLHFHLLLR